MANELQRHKTADRVKWFIVFVALLGLLGAVIAFGVKLDRQTVKERIGGEAYEIGRIGADGAEESGETSIRTRKGVTVSGLKCTIAKDAKIKYEIFFYGKEGKFISSSGELAEDYDGSGIPEGAETAKIVITPTADEDGKVSLVEILGYASRLTVTVDR